MASSLEWCTLRLGSHVLAKHLRGADKFRHATVSSSINALERLPMIHWIMGLRSALVAMNTSR
jgi:hypothetical protein